MTFILDSLNHSQKEAVLYVNGPLLVFAGAGSGKTRVITHKIAYLIDEIGINPSNIVALTFTKKAANEMQSRVNELLRKKVSTFIGTFHSWGGKILRQYGKEYGLDPAFTICDASMQQTIIKELLKNMNTQIPIGTVMFAFRILCRHGKQELMNQIENLSTASKLTVLYQNYLKYKKEHNLVDFDDLIEIPVKLLNKKQDVQDKVKSKIEYVLVDEYQDTNKLQYSLIKSVADKNICVVGDDDQGIYSWRDATIENILQFENDFPNAKIITLDINYRCPKDVLNAAYTVVEHNSYRADKKISAYHEGEQNITIYEAQNEYDEAMWIVGTVHKVINQYGIGLNDIVILYRTNSQSRVFEETLVKFGVSYKIVGATRFYDRQEIKDILAYLRFWANPKDEISAKRVLSVPPKGFGPKSFDKLSKYAQNDGYNIWSVWLWDIIFDKHPVNIDDVRISSNLSRLLNVWKNLQKFDNLDIGLKELLRGLDYKMYLRDKFANTYEDRWNNVLQLFEVCKPYKTSQEEVQQLLESIAVFDDTEEGTQSEALSLMTIHAAKGLEFDVVFLTGLEEGILPHHRSLDNLDQLEEERRLMYVAMTRVKKKLFMSYAVERSQRYASPSRFISEMKSTSFEFLRFP